MSEKDELTQIIHAQARVCVEKFLAGHRSYERLQWLRDEAQTLDALCGLLGLKRLGEMWDE